ncbi:outer membrane lipid asymmetry maintenance protein MlaD [Ottowia beijingensis]|uniref:Outer membrane lipid asymmetry maintenance protein MlaD n=1 Tax=Ottowia beijingensis TaxID=1207057 RepID=A0A853IVD3_9BURK|nr:outer membrane lipid asymmetry maintenance protein MlaD [Ottowia beijingensis]NZA01457.1 outer membrane lipid asymmetry maintenance protein MlaD [Ottowia beijingensis]
MERSKNDLWVGLFVMIGLAALVFLALQAANLLSLNFQSTYRITAQFDNIGGLKPKAAVRSGGVVVGRVAGISFDDERYQARIDLDMDARFKFPKDSSLKILTSGLLGEQYIGVEAGAAEDNLAAGDNVTSTQSAVVLENLISQFLFNSAANAASPTRVESRPPVGFNHAFGSRRPPASAGAPQAASDTAKATGVFQ